ncbi:MAG: hypothetical protein LBF57_02840 [Holosporaceae bacterium]|jgi:mevalonate kinase|nr:hypothetical protein [Holosporaceae bacterium]
MEQMRITTFLSHAKWILSGEHSVIRGGKAIAFPLNIYINSMSLEDSNNFSLVSDQEVLSKDALKLIDIGADFLNIDPKAVKGKIKITNDIPIKTGLGSSAALCVNVAKIFQYYGYCDDIFPLAMRLEDVFHGKSSGLDIAVTLNNKPVIYHNNKVLEFFSPSFWPTMVLTHSGEKSSTAECTEKVQQFFLKDSMQAKKLDDLMSLSSDLCENALKISDFGRLKDGINLANKVFCQWGLCNQTLKTHIDDLILAGAVAAKPVGSGLGGYVLSLWEDTPKNCDGIYLTLEKP